MRVAAALLAITALSFFIFPGHTYLQQDSQIYVPILENQWSGALSGDLLVERPHVNYTLFDEMTGALRWLTRLPLETVLEGEQIVFRALGFWGIYLAAMAIGADSAGALVVTAIWALGAAIAGPAVLTVEYEPTPRSLAVPLLMLAAGFALRNRPWLAGVVLGGAFLLHAPATWPLALALLALAAVRRRAAVAFLPLLAAALLLLAIGSSQSVAEPQRFFDRLPPAQEALQRMRTAYDYVSLWWMRWMGQYLFFGLVATLALWRIHAKREAWALLGGLVLAGFLSVPLSWLLLEHERLALIPQVQPARALLFVTATAVLAAGVAGCAAARQSRRLEAACWFAFALLIPAHDAFFAWPGIRVVFVVFAMSALLAFARRRWRVPAALALAPALAFAAGVVNYPSVATPDLTALADWARSNTPASAVFAFPDAGHDHAPGWFRARSLRPVYVDWKGGGQVNYLREFSAEWWVRWRKVMLHPLPVEEYRGLGIAFICVRHALPDRPPVYRNPSYIVYVVPAN